MDKHAYDIIIIILSLEQSSEAIFKIISVV